MGLSLTERRFPWDPIVAGAFLLYSLRIPFNGLAAHNNMLVANLVIVLITALLVFPMMLSLKAGVLLQIGQQFLILIGPFLFGSLRVDIPQYIATAIIFYCVLRLANLVGPPLRSIHKKS